MLLGSNVFAPMVSLDEREIQLGDLVRWAFYKSKMTTEQWNAMSELDRDLLLVRFYYEMREEGDMTTRKL